MHGFHEAFSKIASDVSRWTGRPLTFLACCAVVLVWGATGPIFHYSDTWQLIINTGTTVVTFLMVFLIQNTQNRDAHALHLKLDELIRANRRARNGLLGLESLGDEELARLQKEFEDLRDEVTHARANRKAPPAHRRQS